MRIIESILWVVLLAWCLVRLQEGVRALVVSGLPWCIAQLRRHARRAGRHLSGLRLWGVRFSGRLSRLWRRQPLRRVPPRRSAVRRPSAGATSRVANSAASKSGARPGRRAASP